MKGTFTKHGILYTWTSANEYADYRNPARAMRNKLGLSGRQWRKYKKQVVRGFNESNEKL